jgi:hypothetical protein
MQKKPFTPYTYQKFDRNDLLRYLGVSQEAAGLYCTGGGKTALAMLVAAGTMGSAWKEGQPRFTHILVAAPTKVVRDAFEELGAVHGDGPEPYETPPVVNEGSFPDGLAGYLAYELPECIVRMTHDKLRNTLDLLGLLQKQCPTFGRKKLLILDEAHHAGEKQILRQIRDLWLSVGGSILYLTATPDRADRTISVPAEVRRDYSVVRSMSHQMAEGYAPEVLLSDIVRVAGASCTDRDTANEPLDPKEVAAQVVAHMEQDAWPKAITRLKGTAKYETHHEIIQSVALAVKAKGKSVFIASGAHGDTPAMKAINDHTIERVRAKLRERGEYEKWVEDKNDTGDLTEVLKYENQVKAIEDSCLDFIIGMHTVLEGLNWRLCSHVYFVGIPLSLLSIIQGVGRAMRNRSDVTVDPLLPWQWQWRSKVVLLAAGSDDKSMRDAHSMQMLSLACYLATFRQWTLLGAVNDVFKDTRFTTPDEEERVRRKVRDLIDIDETKAILIRLALIKMLSFFSMHVDMRAPLSIRQRAKLTVYYINKRLVAQAEEIDRETLASVTERDVQQSLILSRQDARDEFRKGTKEQVEKGIEVSEAVRKTLDTLMEKFEDKSDEDAHTPTVKVITDIIQTLKLDAKTIVEVGVAAHNLYNDQGPPSESPPPQNRRRVQSAIGQAVERLRR